MNEAHLITYLNDHLAASVGAVELIERCRNENTGTDLAKFLATMKTQIASEQKLIKELIHRFGGAESTLKQAAAWLGEKAGRLKLNNEVFRYSDLSRLEEVEILRAGVHAKAGFWTILHSISNQDSRFNGINFLALFAQAQRQYAQIEEYYMEVAEIALAGKTAEAVKNS